MEKHKSLFVLVVAAFLLSAAVVVANPRPAGAAEQCYFVTVYDKENINPVRITVAKGDCVVWMNWKRSGDVSLSFKEGEKCLKAAKTPLDFKMNLPTKCLISQVLQYGQTVSIVFTEPGTYDYDINFSDGGEANASIVVRNE